MSRRLSEGDHVKWTQPTKGVVKSVDDNFFTVTFQDGTDWSFDLGEVEQFKILRLAEPKDRSNGYRDGDVVVIKDLDVVLRYDAVNDSWWHAGPDDHSCHNEFSYGVSELVYRRTK